MTEKNTIPPVITDEKVKQIMAKDPSLGDMLLNPELYAELSAPEMDLERIITRVFECYAKRQALAEREYLVVQDKQTGESVRKYLPRFKSISYHELHSRIKRIANVWKSNDLYRLAPGDFVCCLGPTGIDYITLDFGLIYSHVTNVPLSATMDSKALEYILQQIKPKVLVSTPQYLLQTVQIACQHSTVKYVIMINYDENITQDIQAYHVAQDYLKAQKTSVQLVSLNDLITLAQHDSWEYLPQSGASEDRIAKIIYTSGSTGTPKGVILSAAQNKTSWALRYNATPQITILMMPLYHVSGHTLIISTFAKGGIAYFPCNYDLSNIFEDLQLIRPTLIVMAPRFFELIYSDYQYEMDKRRQTQTNIDNIEQQVKAEIGGNLLGDRLIDILVGSAPISGTVKNFIKECFAVNVLDAYGSTEVCRNILINNRIVRDTVKEYKLREIPELGYFLTDKPYPRGELCIKTVLPSLKYFNDLEANASLLDKDGFLCTGDIVEEHGPYHIVLIDRLKDTMKLSQGEFVALGQLESVFESRSRLIHQMYCYGNSLYAYLLAVIVPDMDLVHLRLGNDFDISALKVLIKEDMQRIAPEANLKSYELPKDFIIELEPFSQGNGLLSGVFKRLRKALKEKYGEPLEALYQKLEHQPLANIKDKAINSREDVFDVLIELLKQNLKCDKIESRMPHTYLQLGGDSLGAVALSLEIQKKFGIQWSVAHLLSPSGSIQNWTNSIWEAFKGRESYEYSFDSVHGAKAKILSADQLDLNRLLDDTTLNHAKNNPVATQTKTVLLTGATGYLGRFICLDWLKKLKNIDGQLICLIRANTDAEAQSRLDEVFMGGDKDLEQTYLSLKKESLLVLAGDTTLVHFGLDENTYQYLTKIVDRVVHCAALVSHIFSYEELFAPNVFSTFEVIRFALTTRNKAIDYISSVAVASYIKGIHEHSPLKSTIVLNDAYASGYAATKWASEQLLHSAYKEFNLSINIFRNNMMLAHQHYKGQINTQDFFTRLLYSVIITGLAPQSFYKNKQSGHYDGLPVDVAATCIVSVGDDYIHACRTYTLQNYHIDDGFSLDDCIDWIINSGYPVQKMEDYQQWLQAFTQALQQIDKTKQQHSALQLVKGLNSPINADATLYSCDNFKHLIEKIKPPIRIPHLDEAYILKCVADITHIDG